MRPWRLLTTSSPLLLGYLFLMGFMTLNQDQLLYLPDPTPPSAANLRPRLGPALAPWPLASGSAFRGYVRAEAGATQGWRGTLVLFHGNAGSARDRTYYLNALEPLGVRVILAEYPGYGGRDGSPSQAAWWLMGARRSAWPGRPMASPCGFGVNPSGPPSPPRWRWLSNRRSPG